jgi:hypothetical protein
MDKANPKLPIYEKKPYTDVDYLVKSILGIKINHRYTELNEKVDFLSMKNLSICFLNTNTIEFIFEEIKSNPSFFSFYLLDELKSRTNLTVLESSFDVIRTNKKFHVQITKSLTDYSELYIETENEISIVKL